MVEQNKMSNKTKGRPNNQNNYSNAVRSIIFTIVLICFAAFLITNMNYGAVQKKDVPISEKILGKSFKSFVIFKKNDSDQTHK